MQPKKTSIGSCESTTCTAGLDQDFSHSASEEVSLQRHNSQHSSASCSSFSLGECINEFKARRARRSLPQNRNQDQVDRSMAGKPSEDVDIISQNRSNKQNEKLSKPCKNGFCYCFTSDSDEILRLHHGEHATVNRKNRKFESNQPEIQIKQNSPIKLQEKKSTNDKLHKRIILPENCSVKTNVKSSTRRLTAISKLEEVSCETSSTNNCPIIHIIQEIHQNCVISEVRVNKNKINTCFHSNRIKLPKNNNICRERSQSYSPKKVLKIAKPNVSEIDSLSEDFTSSTLNTSARSSNNSRNGGRLLKKRLSQTNCEFKIHNPAVAPRKPPRHINKNKSFSSIASTTSSILEANKILDDFLRSRGVIVPETVKKISENNHKNRKSFPLDKPNKQIDNYKIKSENQPLPSCPALSDVEKIDKLVSKTKLLGWNEPQISEMINADVNSHRNAFHSNFSEVGPQTVGWKIPSKQDIDTVDGEDHNLAVNMQSKETPVKSEVFHSNKTDDCNKFVFKEQLMNLVSNSPWNKKNAKVQPKSKSNLKSSSSFLNSSKKKILKFVSSPKDNNKKEKSFHTRSIGIQTSSSNLIIDNNAQSPPGSYFSSMSTTPLKSKGSQTQFDFNRTVNSPPRKDKSTQRKLHFPLCRGQESPVATLTKTYQSYHSDLDKDVSISKMGYILSGIRAKLEASDEHALQTFREIERREQRTDSVDCVDGRIREALRTTTKVIVEQNNDEDPIYSEIEENSFVIAESPQVSSTAIDHFRAENDPAAIYAKVNKISKKNVCVRQTVSLSDLKITKAKRETCDTQSEDMPQYSFNNIRMKEHQSPPKHRYNSKLDLSFQQKDNFLENLRGSVECLNKSKERLEKIQNINLDDSYVSVNSGLDYNSNGNESASYEIPNEPIESHNTSLELPLSTNQSTPKKNPEAIHISKLLLNADECVSNASTMSSSCPLATSKQSLNKREDFQCVESESLNDETTKVRTVSGLMPTIKVRNLKEKLRKSFNRGKNYFKIENKYLSTSLQGNNKLEESTFHDSSLSLDKHIQVNESAPLKEQLAQAVSICRQTPDLEISQEMVEAERLLLFSNLKSIMFQKNLILTTQKNIKSPMCLSIEALRLPIKPHIHQDLVFKYFYICVFSCGNQIKYTKSIECENREAAFRDCDISFMSSTDADEISCNIFMLRLRKVSTLIKSPPPSLKQELVRKSPTSSCSSTDDIVSRFRLHGKFQISPMDFRPFHYDYSVTEKDSICLRGCNECTKSVNILTRSSNVPNEIFLSGKVEMRFPKFRYSGFLNVQDPQQKHSWNKRWCSIDGLMLIIRYDNSVCNVNQSAICSCDLTKCSSTETIDCAPKDLCARPRSFHLALVENDFYFSADNQTDLNNWLQALNEVLNFVNKWIK